MAAAVAAAAAAAAPAVMVGTKLASRSKAGDAVGRPVRLEARAPLSKELV